MDSIFSAIISVHSASEALRRCAINSNSLISIYCYINSWLMIWYNIWYELEWLSGREKSLMILSAVWIQYTSVTDRQTDRQMDTDQWLVPRLRMTLSGKNIAYIKSIPFCLKRNVAFKQNSSKKGKHKIINIENKHVIFMVSVILPFYVWQSWWIAKSLRKWVTVDF